MTHWETATLAGGCFWCIEAAFLPIRGIEAAVSGYMGGHIINPTYEEVCGKRTGHAEVVQLQFNPAELSYREILQMFFTLHDPTTPNRQGNDVGPQYRSAIFYHDESQKQIAEEVMAQVSAEKWYSAPLVTELTPLEPFYPAEAYHQNYYARNPYQGYCMAVVAPKVAKMRKLFADRLK